MSPSPFDETVIREKYLTHYTVLGVLRSASSKEIRAAFLVLARKNHPDLFREERAKKLAEARMKLINGAYTVLSDVARRLEYDEILDRYGSATSDDYARRRSEEYWGTWNRPYPPSSRARREPEPERPRKPGEARYGADGKKIADVVHVDGPRTINHGRPYRQKNQTVYVKQSRTVVVMEKQGVKVREPRRKP